MNQSVRTLSNEMLIALLNKRVELEASNEAEMIDYFREVMRRKLWLEFGASSMFDFMTHAHFHFAPAVAQRKIDAARLMQVFPEIKEAIAAGELNLTQLGMLASGLRQKPVALKVQGQILQALRGQTVKNSQVILNETLELEIKTRTKIRVQRDGSVRAEMTFSKEDWEAVTRAKEVVSHSVPSGDESKVLSYCARFTVAKKDFAASKTKVTSKTNSAPASKNRVKVKFTSADGSAAVSEAAVSRASRRYVFQRDRSCRQRHPDGRICDSRYQLQVDHIISRWAGGGNEVGNLQLLCGVHNRYKFEREIGQFSPESPSTPEPDS